ncbi:MAG: hypothetical protein GXO02_05515 [Epsilonproteobacteria bacterium]|nr:hypothetical protein [Campylobacterota bacterium]
MLIVIPVKDENNLTIAPRMGAKKWVAIDFEEGVIKNQRLIDDPFKEFDWIDFAILENSFENYMDFLDIGTMVLVRREGQDSIEDLIEAFKFKELDEIGSF